MIRIPSRKCVGVCNRVEPWEKDPILTYSRKEGGDLMEANTVDPIEVVQDEPKVWIWIKSFLLVAVVVVVNTRIWDMNKWNVDPSEEEVAEFVAEAAWVVVE
jgi:hypothetical protein